MCWLSQFRRGELGNMQLRFVFTWRSWFVVLTEEGKLGFTWYICGAMCISEILLSVKPLSTMPVHLISIFLLSFSLGWEIVACILCSILPRFVCYVYIWERNLYVLSCAISVFWREMCWQHDILWMNCGWSNLIEKMKMHQLGILCTELHKLICDTLLRTFLRFDEC